MNSYPMNSSHHLPLAFFLCFSALREKGEQKKKGSISSTYRNIFQLTIKIYTSDRIWSLRLTSGIYYEIISRKWFFHSSYKNFFFITKPIYRFNNFFKNFPFILEKLFLRKIETLFVRKQLITSLVKFAQAFITIRLFFSRLIINSINFFVQQV